MVYVSTKIKKNAAEAFDREIIETEEFSLIKPEGLMHPLRDKSEFAFEAFSKDFGDGNLKNYWQANAELAVHTNKSFTEVCAPIKVSAEIFSSDEIEKDPTSKPNVCLYKGEQIIDEVKKVVFWKVAESSSKKKVYEFRVFVLKEYEANYADRVRTMLESFTVK
jgi:hypothetical protein